MLARLQHSITRRLNNFSLSPSPENALIGVYEAIANSIHAASDTGHPSKTRIDITVVRDKNGDPDGFIIEDNGVGLNSQNFDSFCRVDSDFKLTRGGKGVGRLMWLKTFESVLIESQYAEGQSWFLRKFKFVLNDDEPFSDYSLKKRESGPARTIIRIARYESRIQINSTKACGDNCESYHAPFCKRSHIP